MSAHALLVEFGFKFFTSHVARRGGHPDRVIDEAFAAVSDDVAGMVDLLVQGHTRGYLSHRNQAIDEMDQLRDILIDRAAGIAQAIKALTAARDSLKAHPSELIPDRVPARYVDSYSGLP